MYMITTMQSTIPYTNLSTHPQGLSMKKKQEINSVSVKLQTIPINLKYILSMIKQSWQFKKIYQRAEQSILEANKLILTLNHKVSPFVLSFNFFLSLSFFWDGEKMRMYNLITVSYIKKVIHSVVFLGGKK